MKTLKEQISSTLYTKKVIGDKDLFEVLEGCGYKDYALSSIIDKCISNIESLIKENYVEKEFVRWFAEQDEFYHCIIDDEEKWYIPDWSTNILPKYLSFDELYDHWKREVKSKQDEKSL